ncbi:hypothetical protein LJB86_03485 [Deltaproteobacteria bacterium OttesenSCG-928-M10]|nr:hypothetical protein [Deltaproteobacteria bacterium OttesenSCG-928-M10]
MDLLQNPFYILAASPRDNRRRIIELADERSLLLDSNECTEARSDLTNPRKRLSAEAAWLPGAGPKRTAEVLSIVESSPAGLLAVDKLSSMARANLLAAGLARLPAYNVDDVVKWILALSLVFEKIDPEELRTTINEERVVSGFPEVSDISVVEAEIRERRRHYQQVIKSALDNLSPKDLVQAVTVAVDAATDEGEHQGPVLIADLVDSYEIEAQVFLDREGENIKILVEKLRAAIDADQADPALASKVSQLIKVVKNWDTVAQPIQVSTKGRGLSHEASHRVADMVRSLAIYMFNDHGKLDLSQQLTHMLQEVFAEVVEVAERTAEDADALEDIAEQRARLIEDAENGFDEWQREITYEANVGALFTGKLRISPDGIEWKRRRWPLDSITRIRWGGTMHSTDGIPTGTTFSITFGIRHDSTTIVLRKHTIFFNFIERLWKAVGIRLLTEHLEGLRDGKKYNFGDAVISDYGVELVRYQLCGNERVFYRWNDLSIWNAPGVFCIGKKNDEDLSTELSYQEEDNVHVIEAAIRMFWKKGGDRLSSLLKN